MTMSNDWTAKGVSRVSKRASGVPSSHSSGKTSWRCSNGRIREISSTASTYSPARGMAKVSKGYLAESIALFGDPKRIFPAKVKVLIY